MAGSWGQPTVSRTFASSSKKHGTIPAPPLYSPLTDLPCQSETLPENATGLRLLRSPDSAKNNKKDSQIVEYQTFLPLCLRPC